MENPEHLEILAQGVKVWNKWREENPDVIPDLEDVNLFKSDLREMDMRGVVLVGANLLMADLSGADLRWAILKSAYLTAANLSKADLSGANLSGANLTATNLSGANLSGANLLAANLIGANLLGVDLSEACFIRTVLIDVDLSCVKHLESCTHYGPSTVDHQTLQKSGRLPDVFLKGIGWPDILIETIVPFFDKSPIKFYTGFISYSTKDEKFATRLHNDLQASGIRCWKWDLDAKTGRDLWGEINDAIRVYDKLVLILSKNSLSNPHVGREIERAIEKENINLQKQAKGELDGDPNVLFPVRLDDKIFKWDHHRKNDVTRKVIADAKGWNRDNNKYEKVLKKLIEDLKK